MGKKAKLLISFIAILFVASCASMKYQRINADMSLITIGMAQDTVVDRIGKPNMVVIAQTTQEGALEVYEYRRVEFNSITQKNEDRPIWIYFIDKKVVEWGPGEDWQMGSAATQRWIDGYRERSRR